MAVYNQHGDRVLQGKDCWIYIGTSPADADVLGFAQDFSIRVQVQTQKAEVLGEFLPISIDATGVSVNTSFKGFIPKKGVSYSNGKWTVKNLAPTTSAIVDGEKIIKIPYMELRDKKSGSTICATTWAILNGYNETVSGKGYVMADVSFESIGFENGSDYKTTDLYTSD